jgi:hypothetical protein
MIFTTTRELLLDYTSASLFLCGEQPPSYAVDLVNVGDPTILSVRHKDAIWRGAHDELMVNSSSHSEGFVFVEE